MAREGDGMPGGELPPLYDRPQVSRAYFFPRPGRPLAREADRGPVVLRGGEGLLLGAYRVRSLPRAPVLLYLHGNGEIIRDQLPRWPEWARAAGANLLLLDYPGYATSEGEPSLSACRRAARAALSWLLSRPAVEVPSVILVGRSVGSIFALDAAAASPSPRVSGLVLESGVAELTRRLADRVPWARVGIDREELLRQLARDFDHRERLRRLRCPLLVLHARGDTTVPPWNGERLAEWAGEKLWRLVLFERGDHNSIQEENAGPYRDLLAEFVASVSSRPAGGR
jgi:pimeloyl-ACP methyl ester carboxylesterase